MRFLNFTVLRDWMRLQKFRVFSQLVSCREKGGLRDNSIKEMRRKKTSSNLTKELYIQDSVRGDQLNFE